MLHCEPTEEQSHHSYRNVHFVSQVTWHQPLTLRNFNPKVGASSTPCGSISNPTMEKTISSNVSSKSQTWQWRITHFLFPANCCKPPFWLGISQLSMFDYPKRSHRSPSPSLFSCHDIHSGFTSLACAEHAEARILQCAKRLQFQHEATKMGPEYIVSLESNIKPDIYSPL